MKLWLDDTRKPPDPSWHWIRTAEEACAWLAQDCVTAASLDHDLGYSLLGRLHFDGIAVVEWLERQEREYRQDHWPPDGCAVHSMNPVGAARMRAVIAAHYAPPLAPVARADEPGEG